MYILLTLKNIIDMIFSLCAFCQVSIFLKSYCSNRISCAIAILLNMSDRTFYTNLQELPQTLCTMSRYFEHTDCPS